MLNNANDNNQVADDSANQNQNGDTQLTRADGVPSPRNSPPYRSRGTSPQRVPGGTSRTAQLTKFTNTQRTQRQQISEALIILTVAVSARAPASPRIDLTNTPRNGDTGGLPTDPGMGDSGMPNNLDLQNLVMTLQKKIKEQWECIEKIPKILPAVTEIDIDKKLQPPWKANAALLPILKKFTMPNIPMYDGTTDPRYHMMAQTTIIKRNNLTKSEIESVLMKKFGETLTKGVLTLYSMLPRNSMNSFAEIAEALIKANTGT